MKAALHTMSMCKTVLRARGGGGQVLKAEGGRGQVLKAEGGRGLLLEAGSGQIKSQAALWDQDQRDLSEFEVIRGCPRSFEVVGYF